MKNKENKQKETKKAKKIFLGLTLGAGVTCAVLIPLLVKNCQAKEKYIYKNSLQYTKIVELKSENDSVTEALLKTQDNLTRLQLEHEQLLKAKADVDEELRLALEQNNRDAKLIEELRQKQKELEEEIQKAHENYNALQNKYDDLNEQKNLLESRVQDLRIQLIREYNEHKKIQNQLELKLANLTKDYQKALNLIKEKEAEIKQKQDSINKLEKDNKAKQKEIDLLNNQKADLINKYIERIKYEIQLMNDKANDFSVWKNIASATDDEKIYPELENKTEQKWLLENMDNGNVLNEKLSIVNNYKQLTDEELIAKLFDESKNLNNEENEKLLNVFNNFKNANNDANSYNKDIFVEFIEKLNQNNDTKDNTIQQAKEKLMQLVGSDDIDFVFGEDGKNAKEGSIVQNLWEKIRQKDNEIETKDNQIRQNEEQIGSLNSELEQKQRDYQELNTNYEQLDTNFKQKVEEIKQLETQKSSLEQQLKETKEQKATLEQQLSDAQREKSSLEADLRNKNQEISSKEAEIQRLKRELEEAKRNNKDNEQSKNARIQQLQSMYDEKQREVTELKEQVKQLQEQNSQKDNEIEEKNRENQRLEQEIDEKEQTISSLNEQIKSKDSEIKTKDAEIDKLTKQLKLANVNTGKIKTELENVKEFSAKMNEMDNTFAENIIKYLKNLYGLSKFSNDEWLRVYNNSDNNLIQSPFETLNNGNSKMFNDKTLSFLNKDLVNEKVLAKFNELLGKNLELNKLQELVTNIKKAYKEIFLYENTREDITKGYKITYKQKAHYNWNDNIIPTIKGNTISLTNIDGDFWKYTFKHTDATSGGISHASHTKRPEQNVWSWER
ncbi:hypothetical protein [[Mycoplasma] gypis]|uniref:Chromosome segregation protein SMC n=1 Tax=[Mycoplasma] gypis TaxID=92404 RepID=A0ABZ2RQ88_9BACT|nr:hypothetical protein [[Mycoplasma] gypis]MBN0919383.1 hypothetical protein [[Mycoplasma] gypis]